MRAVKPAALCAASLAIAALLVAGPPPADPYPFIVADATDVYGLSSVDIGAVYRVHGAADVETIWSGPPLRSPCGLLLYSNGRGAQRFLVSDIGDFYEPDDGGVYLIGDDITPVVIYEGAPLFSPYGMLLDKKKRRLYLADFGDPVDGIFDGALYVLDLDPDGDGEAGPFPLDPDAIDLLYAGEPLEGPNQMVWLSGGENRILLADDSGWLYRIHVKRSHPVPEPFGPEFVDPVGLVQDDRDFIVVDARSQEIYRLDRKGEELELLISGDLITDQFLGVDKGRRGQILVANARSLVYLPGDEDGEILRLTKEGTSVPYAGDPLANPFSVLFVRAPKD
jgi:hypothetical protein